MWQGGRRVTGAGERSYDGSGLMRIVFFVLAVSAAVPGGAVEIVAHRGASHEAPENTLSSVKLGWEQDADAVEFDVWLSRDGQAVLMHDKDTKRIGGRDKLVAEQTYEELRQLDVGAWKAEKYRGERVPLVADVLSTLPKGKRFLVELKCGPEVLPELKRSFEAAGTAAEEAAIICFDYDTTVAAKATFPDREVYWLSSIKRDEATGEWLPRREELIEKAKAAGFDGLDLQARPVIDATYVKAVKDAGLAMHVWTVDDPIEAKRLAEAGVDGLTTNRPGFMRETLGEARNSKP